MNDLLKNIDIKKYEGLVVYIARKYANKSGTYIEDELISAGYDGLMDAINRFDIKKSNRFDTYAPYRIEGSIIDKLRNLDRHSRNTRRWIKKIEVAILRVESNKMEPAEDHEIANELRITLDKYNKIICRIYNNTHLSIDEYLNFKDNNSPKTKTFHERNFGHNTDQTNEIYKKEIKLIVKNAIACLSDRERLIIKLYYYENYTMKKIGNIINITEPRVCQINQEIIEKLKLYFQETCNEII